MYKSLTHSKIPGKPQIKQKNPKYNWQNIIDTHFFKGRHPNDEKVSNITNDQGSTNQNQNEILPHMC